MAYQKPPKTSNQPSREKKKTQPKTPHHFTHINMHFCMYKEVVKKTQMSPVLRGIKMQFRGSFLLVYEHAKPW